jgi:hypothetical protein
MGTQMNATALGCWATSHFDDVVNAERKAAVMAQHIEWKLANTFDGEIEPIAVRLVITFDLHIHAVGCGNVIGRGYVFTGTHRLLLC